MVKKEKEKKSEKYKSKLKQNINEKKKKRQEIFLNKKGTKRKRKKKPWTMTAGKNEMKITTSYQLIPFYASNYRQPHPCQLFISKPIVVVSFASSSFNND